MIKITNIAAFTLAETLVTLCILGVIAALTMPGLQDFSQSRSNVALAQKAYSTLSNATKALKAEYGPIRLWDMTTTAKVTTMYKEKMNAAGTVSAPYDTKYLNGSVYTNANMFAAGTSFISSDGMLFYVQSVSPACTGGDDILWKGCINWGVDVNGARGPNKVGIDIFGFYVNGDGVHPEGSIERDGDDTRPTLNTTDCSKTSLGWSCSAKIITDGNITWK